MVQLDMDMPTRCFDCLIEQADDYTMSYECPLVYKGYTGEIRMTGRLAECPLRDVQPVGENEKMSDLISRQAAIDGGSGT